MLYIEPIAPYVGAWIETSSSASVQTSLSIAPYVGAWIETTKMMANQQRYIIAPYVGAWIETPDYPNGINTERIAPYVGAWIETSVNEIVLFVYNIAPYVGAWIETLKLWWMCWSSLDRSLRGSVSWNFSVWATLVLRSSLPMWERVLKLGCLSQHL